MYPNKNKILGLPHTALDKGGRSVSILLAGQIGAGRSTLINMITGTPDGSAQAAKVSNDVRPCSILTTVHTALLEVDGMTLNCGLWDTRGLDEAVDHPNFVEIATNWFRQQGFGLFSKGHSDHDLRDVCRQRVDDLKDSDPSRHVSIVILMWCIHASKIDVPIHWQHFRKVYVEYCGRRVRPVVVITQMTPEFTKGWDRRCADQLKKLNLGIQVSVADDLLLMVRKYRDTASPEYAQDSLALKHLIFRLSGIV